MAAPATLARPAAPATRVNPAAPAPRLGDADQQRLDALADAHRRAKAQLTQENVSDLDFIVERARRALGPSSAGNLMATVTRSVNATVPGLTEAETQAIASYVIAEIASTKDTPAGFNSQYLQLQPQARTASRTYSTLSNIMKSKHDTVKNSISNIR
jgi:hypothetical protein